MIFALPPEWKSVTVSGYQVARSDNETLSWSTNVANTNAPFGFRQYSGNGSAPTYEQVEVLIKSTNTTAIFFGDPVIGTNDGYITTVGISTGSLASGVQGIFVGCKYLSVSQKRTVWSNYWPGSDNNGDVYAYIVNDPNARFLVQTDSTGATQADVNANVGINIGTGNTANGISGAVVATSTTPTTTNTLPFRILSLVTNPPGAAGTDAGAYNYVVVGFNNAATKQLTGI